jgi:hypothetical protein
MSAQVSFNPTLTTNALGSFGIQSNGLVQGFANDDPSIRNALAGGTVSSSETVPMWGGIAIYENVPEATSNQGGEIGRAASLDNLTGFSVFNQAYAGIQTPQSPVPLFATNATLSFYRLGSGARIAVKVDPALVSLEGGLITQQVSWNFTTQTLVAFSVTALPVKVLKIFASNCKTVSYDPATGFATWNNNGACALIQI